MARNRNKPPAARRREARSSRSWDPVADWYAGWAGPEGSRHHRELAVPALLELLKPRSGEWLLDIGCGAGALAPTVLSANARYLGVDLSPRLIALARRHHGAKARFLVGDATRLAERPEIGRARFDAAAFLLSLQDIDPLEDAVRSAAWALRRGGRLVAVMTHPCFRVPRQSGWGWDEGRRLRYRRIDSYLTPLQVPMQPYGRGRPGSTRSYHRPLEAYTEALRRNGFLLEALREIPAGAPAGTRQETRAERLARQEIPLFFALRARRDQRA